MQTNEIEDIYPLSPLQEGLLFQSLYEPDSQAYLIQLTFAFSGPFDVETFRASWNILCQRHAVLRTSFMHEDLARPVQVVLKNRSVEFALEDLCDRSAAEQQQRIDTYQQCDRERGFDLQRDVLMRVGVFRCGQDQHRVVWSYHHILIDGWCLKILYDELMQIYDSRCSARPLNLPPVAPYRDYIGWLEQQDKQQGVAFWVDYLKGYERLAALPRLPDTTPALAGDARRVDFQLDKDLTNCLKDLAAGLGVTQNIVIQCVWGILLAYYNRLDDVVFGTIVSGRPPELDRVEEMVGLFINAVPVRMQLDRSVPFSEFVRTVQASSLVCEPFHHVPLADVQAAGSANRQLFDHLLIFENYPMPSSSAAENGAPARCFTVETLSAHDRTHYDLDITILPGDQISIQLAFNANVYSADQIRRTAAHLQTVIDSAVRHPQAPLSSIRIMPADEARRIEREFCGTTVSIPRDETIVDMFGRRTEQAPHSVAVIADAVTLTYQQLNQQANRLANCLRGMGVGRGVVVGICTERNAEMIVAILAVLKSGAAYLPLDPGYPQQRLCFMIDDAEIAVLISQRKLLDRLPRQSTRVVCLDEVQREIAQYSDQDPGCAIAPDDLAYVIYTSGSTGTPKGVAVEHQNLVNAAYAWWSAYDFNRLDVRLLQIASMSFDVFAGDFVRALTSGGQLIVCPDDVRLDPPSLYELLAKYRVDIFEATPGLIVPLMDFIYEQNLPVDFLKVLILGSDALPAAHYQQLVDRFGRQMRIINSYGVTEATIDSTYFESRNGLVDVSSTTPIGKPLTNVHCFVWDGQMRAVPIGVMGELFVGGAGVARGYLNRDALTAERFLVHPQHPQQRVYRTGDLVRWLPDGNLQFLGRADDQVKLRGYRIEPAEIENRLLFHPRVRSAAVLVRKDCDGDQALVAYVVSDDPWDAGEFRRFASDGLPDYMIPNFFVRVDELPLTSNGKVDKRALPDLASMTQDQPNTFVPPRTRQEEQVADIWQQCLRVERVGVHDNFFELGGHSLKAMQIVSRIQRDLGVGVRLQELFTHPTIAELMPYIESGPIADDHEIPAAPQQDYYELSHAQKRLWLQHQFDTTGAYNMPEAYVINAPVEMPIVRRAFSALIARHEALRTAFVEVDGELRQKIHPRLDFNVEHVDLTALDAPELPAREITDQFANQPFDLTAPPLLRAAIIKLAPDRHVFVLTIHHIIGDGWSGVILFRELLALYDAFRHGRSNPLRPLRIQYKDFTFWQNARGFQREEDYWVGKLEGMPECLRLPYDHPPADERDFRGSTQTRDLPADMARGLRLMAARFNTTVSNVVLTLFKLTLYQWTRQDDFCVGMSIANRNHPDLENLVGFFVNILPIRSQFSPDMEFEDLLRQVMHNTYEAFAHQDYPFDLLIQRLNPKRSSNRQPIFNVLYAFQNFTDIHVDTGAFPAERDVDGERSDALDSWTSFEFSFATSKFDLTLFVLEDGDVIHLSLEYDTGLFLERTINGLLERLRRYAEMSIKQLVNTPAVPAPEALVAQGGQR